jgi:CubicO group peptidase (beta-lactamase class C family)
LLAKMQDLKVPGALIGVYRAGQPAREYALGQADVAQARPMTPDCHVRIASLSKVFVATALLTLVDDGKVSADEAISKYVPNVPNGDRITLRHLATHRSGLFNPIESKLVKHAFAADPRKTWSEDEILQFSLQAPPYFAPGTQHHYSNANTILLAKVIANVTGQPWPTVLQQRVLDPLGLKHTRVASDNELPTPFAHGYARGGPDTPFFVRGDTVHDVTRTSPSWWGAAGNLISTLGDLGKAAQPLATGALLKERGRRELHTWTPADQAEVEYGFHLEKINGRLGHDGDVPGYQSFMFYLPEQQASVVAVATLYGWSVRGMPANELAQLAIAELCPDRATRIERGLRPFAEATGAPQQYSLTDRMTHYGVPGVSVAVMERGQMVWTHGYGVRTVGQPEAVTADTRFQAASISKLVTATVALRLVDAGQLTLDADVQPLLKDWQLPRSDPEPRGPVTVRQLLQHTAGIGTRGFVGYPADQPVPTALEVLNGSKPANSPAVRVMQTPGQAANYSGGGYQVLQQVLTNVSRQPFPALARQQVFDPLQLAQTDFTQPLARTTTGVASGHDQGQVLPGRWFTYPELAAAGLWSTPRELATLLLAVRSAAQGTDGFLRPATARALLTSATLPNGQATGHGLGAEIDGTGPTLRFGHAGGTVGYRCVSVLFQEAGCGAVVMTNGNAGDALAGELLRSIAAEYGWPGTDFQPRVRATVRKTPVELAAYAGEYGIEGNGIPVTVRVDGAGLRVETKFKAPLPLLPAGAEVFFATSQARELHFERAASGAVVAAKVVQDGQTLFRIVRAAP